MRLLVAERSLTSVFISAVLWYVFCASSLCLRCSSIVKCKSRARQAYGLQATAAATVTSILMLTNRVARIAIGARRKRNRHSRCADARARARARTRSRACLPPFPIDSRDSQPATIAVAEAHASLRVLKLFKACAERNLGFVSANARAKQIQRKRSKPRLARRLADRHFSSLRQSEA